MLAENRHHLFPQRVIRVVGVVLRWRGLRRADRIGGRKGLDQACFQAGMRVLVGPGCYPRIFGQLVVRRGIEFLSHRISPLTPTCRRGESSPGFCAAPPICRSLASTSGPRAALAAHAPIFLLRRCARPRPASWQSGIFDAYASSENVYIYLRLSIRKNGRKRAGATWMNFEQNLFISFTHIDNQPLTDGDKGWITRFHATLKTLLSMRMGREAKIWRADKLQGKDVFSDEIIEQLKRSAALVSIVSSRYLQSEWCTREARLFCDNATQ